MSHLIAAIDESMRAQHYLLCATVASTADRPHIRRSLRALLLPNQRRLHAKHESDGRKKALLKSFADLPAMSCYVAIGPRTGDGREGCLRLLSGHLAVLGVREIVLEHVDRGTSRHDRQILQDIFPRSRSVLGWRHERPEHEPLLWVSDVVLSTYGAGGELRRASQFLVTSVLRVNTK